MENKNCRPYYPVSDFNHNARALRRAMAVFLLYDSALCNMLLGHFRGCVCLLSRRTTDVQPRREVFGLHKLGFYGHFLRYRTSFQSNLALSLEPGYLGTNRPFYGRDFFHRIVRSEVQTRLKGVIVTKVFLFFGQVRLRYSTSPEAT